MKITKKQQVVLKIGAIVFTLVTLGLYVSCGFYTKTVTEDDALRLVGLPPTGKIFPEKVGEERVWDGEINENEITSFYIAWVTVMVATALVFLSSGEAKDSKTE